MSYDYSKLLGKIKEVYGTQEIFAKQLGISRTSLNQRLTGKLEFSQNEISKSMKLLGEPYTEIDRYFFCIKSLEK